MTCYLLVVNVLRNTPTVLEIFVNGGDAKLKADGLQEKAPTGVTYYVVPAPEDEWITLL
jgi:hypothetical protein